MDCGILCGSPTNGGGRLSPSPRPSPAAGSLAAVEAEAELDGGERESLLPRRPRAGTARNSRREAMRRVQWKDSHGKKLVEVLEFQPSDSSDSDDEYMDSCVCSIM